MNLSKLALLVICVLLVSSCASREINERNNENLSSLEKGMTKAQVLAVMGEPLRDEVYNEENVWYYFTQVKWSDGRITRDECTPVFFEEEKLVGWGWVEFNKHRQRNW